MLQNGNVLVYNYISNFLGDFMFKNSKWKVVLAVVLSLLMIVSAFYFVFGIVLDKGNNSTANISELSAPLLSAESESSLPEISSASGVLSSEATSVIISSEPIVPSSSEIVTSYVVSSKPLPSSSKTQISSDVVSKKPVSSKPPVKVSSQIPVSSQNVTSVFIPNKTGKETGKVCYLTFDDGPSDNTLKILNILDKYDAVATFFVVGSGKLEYTKNIVAQGSKVGMHSQSHKYSVCYASDKAYFDGLDRLGAKLETIIGEKPNIIRFPGGSSNTVSKKYSKGIMTRLTRNAYSKGYHYFDWNIDSYDASASKVSEKTIVSKVLSGAKNKNRICVLMHDSSGKDTTAEALDNIIVGLKKMGFTFAVLDEDSYGFHHGVNN